MQSTQDQSLPPALLELKAMFSKRLAAPLPKSYDERLSLLENHLREVTACLTRSPSIASATGPEQVAQVISLTRQISADIRGAQKTSTLRMSDCDSAAAWGVGLITVGAIGGGGVGAVAGFAMGVYLLAESC